MATNLDLLPENPYSSHIVEVQSQLDNAIKERDQVNIRIIRMQAQLRALYALSDQQTLTPDDDEVIGLTDAVRSVMRLAGKPMQAAEVKTNLDIMGFNFRNSANPSASVHNTLKRMLEQGEVTYAASTKQYALSRQRA